MSWRINEILLMIGFILICLGIGVGIKIGKSMMEAKTFNKLTGRTDVTWKDALWVELRVDRTKGE